VQIQVVFHVVYNDAEENLPDSVFTDQIRVLNESFRRLNADTVNLRADFKDLVGDSHIEFVLAENDPDGKPTSGITRTKTSVKTFGGTLPYGSGQQDSILAWVNDSLFINMFRISETANGGHDPWDETRYLNVWVGDLRIFEPKFNNFEELVYFALATPPDFHENWPDSLSQIMSTFNEGVLLHYHVAGSNNPAKFTGAYSVYNGLVTGGKMLVHETGHYLGLRHIWADGDCSHDDYIDDTPRASSASQYNCATGLNTCTDTIKGKDLPNMIENYMDYSSSDCQNSFTKGQIELMRAVLENYRKPLVSVKSINTQDGYSIYPNPNQGTFYVNSTVKGHEFSYVLYDFAGKVVKQGQAIDSTETISIEGKAGTYFLEITTADEAKRQVLKVAKH
jgi:hypothetical protein